jgi:hypothetical protein
MNALKILTDKNLTIAQVVNVVDYWYGIYRSKNIGVIQSTNGLDLEEIVQNTDIPFWYEGSVIEEYKLNDQEVLLLVSFWYNEIYLNEEASDIYNNQFGLILTELTLKDVNKLFGAKIGKEAKQFLFADEPIDLGEYIDLELAKLYEDADNKNALNNFNLN